MLEGNSVVLLRAVAFVAVLQSVAATATQGEPFGVEDFIFADYSENTVSVAWKSDTELVYSDSEGLRCADLNGPPEKDVLLVPQEVFDEINPVRTTLSADATFALLANETLKDIASVISARFIVYSIADGTKIPLGYNERLHHVKWGPNNRLVYVFENNIYYLSEPAAEPVKITTDGEPYLIYNGILLDYGDLTEVAASTVCGGGTVSWSPDGTRIAFHWYNASEVRSAYVNQYHTTLGAKYLYTKDLHFYYPKPGTPIATVKLKVATLPSKNSTSVTIQELVAPVDVVGHEHYIVTAVWIDNNVLMASWQNRVGNITQIVSYDTSTKEQRLHGSKGLKLERKDGWAGRSTLMPGYLNASTYLMIDWEPQGEAGSFPHVVKVTGTSRTPITSGEFTVTNLYGWDTNNVVYFQATERGEPSRRHVYAVQEGDSPHCLSCNVTTPEGNACTRASAQFSEAFSYMIFTCHGPDPPVVSLRETANFTGSFTLEGNSELREKLSQKQVPRRLDDWVDLGDGMRAQVRMWLPPGLDPEGSEKRPAVVEVYAGPETQQIDDSFLVDPYSYFTTSRRYVYIFIDGRGSACKGDRMLFSVYRRLGTVEIQDQIDVTKRLTEKYGFIDSSNVAIWGWSYGGYAAAMALARDEENVFKCGASVAPLTDFRLYTAMYSETYMGYATEEDNEAGYEESDLTEMADRFINKSFLLIHGSGDDNVLYEHTMNLALALEKAGVLFRQQIYPDERHSIRALRTHVFRTIDAFFVECFDEQSITPSASAVNSAALPVIVATLISTILRVL